jgi:hypothetical protein
MVLVGLQVRHPPRLVRLIAMDRAFRFDPQASDASVALGAVRLAADLPLRYPEAVRDSRQSAWVAAREP